MFWTAITSDNCDSDTDNHDCDDNIISITDSFH